ncbi:MAG: adenosylcobinamide-GDP ribazoletransferase [Candidatus Bathyarchaeia archaeon]
MLKSIKNMLSFLTIFPVGMTEDCLNDAAEHMYLFPLIGALLGFLAGIFALVLNHVLPNLIVGALACSFLLLLTGLHHTDGLLDFGDGLMCHGTPEEKIKAMHDVQTGTGGFILGIITILTTTLSISQLGNDIILQSLVVSEVSAKLAMVVLAWLGRSAHKGMNTYFVKAMHGNHQKMTEALIISLVIALITLKIMGLIIIILGIITASILLAISNKHFRGITGDVMGASNELTRMVSLLIILALNQRAAWPL